MNKIVSIFLVMLTASESAIAGSVAGFGGGTEVTQLLNNIQLINAYEQQVQGYVRQGLQLQNEIKNLTQNPASLLGTDVGNLINGVGKIMAGANSIGGNLAQIDKNFATTFKSPTAATLSQNFTKWHSTSTSTLEGALKSAGMHRDQFTTDTDAIQALYNQSQNTGGNMQALQTLAQINIKQLQQSQALGDLMATQNIASSTYMAAQSSKGQAVQDRSDAIQAAAMATLPATPTSLTPNTQAYKKWNLYTTK